MTATDRASARITLAEQLVAWVMYRRGDSVDLIANGIQRPKPATRALLFGPQP